MANHKSAQKRAKQNIIKSQRNKSYMSKVKTAVKRFKESLAEFSGDNTGDKEKAMKLRSEAQSALDKAVKKGLLHRNNASRRIKRLAMSHKKAVNPS